MGTGHGVRKPMQPRRRKVMLKITAVKRGQPNVVWDGYFSSDATESIQSEFDAWDAASDKALREFEDRLDE